MEFKVSIIIYKDNKIISDKRHLTTKVSTLRTKADFSKIVKHEKTGIVFGFTGVTPTQLTIDSFSKLVSAAICVDMLAANKKKKKKKLVKATRIEERLGGILQDFPTYFIAGIKDFVYIRDDNDSKQLTRIDPKDVQTTGSDAIEIRYLIECGYTPKEAIRLGSEYSAFISPESEEMKLVNFEETDLTVSSILLNDKEE